MRRALWVVAAICALVAVPGAAAVATPPFQVVMSGLDNLRGLAWGPEGALYVAEVRRGGPEGLKLAGFTGSVSRLWHGDQTRVITETAVVGRP